MNKIKLITDINFGIKSKKLKNPQLRYASRGIVVRDDGKIAVFYKQKLNEYKLPGGGIEEGENPEEAFKREILEETGCDVKISKLLGYTEERKGLTNFKQISYVYIGEVVKDYNHLNLTDKEKGEGAKLIWLYPQDAYNIIKNCINEVVDSPVDKYENMYSTKFVVFRDMSILEYYLKNI